MRCRRALAAPWVRASSLRQHALNVEVEGDGTFGDEYAFAPPDALRLAGALLTAAAPGGSMSLRSVVRLAIVTFAATTLSSTVWASSITYQMSATASGSIGGQTFTDALVTLLGTGDTSAVVPLSFCENGTCITYYAEAITTTVTIAGIGTATITDPTGIWSIPTPVSVPEFPSNPFVLIGRIDHPPALDSFTGIGFNANDALTGYDLTTAIGPITGLGGIGFPQCGVPGTDPCLATTLGLLSFTSNAGSEFNTTSTFTATVPEPSSLFLLGSGVAVLFGRSRRRSRPS